MSSARTVIDTSKFSEACARLRAVVGKEAGEQILKEETAQLIKTTIRLDNQLTVMHAVKGTTGRTVREWAVARAIKRTMRPISPEQFTDPRMKKFMEFLTSRADNADRNRLLGRMTKGPLKGTSAPGFKAANHRDNIHRATGKTARTGYLLFGAAQHAQLAEYIRGVQSHVGWKFAGFGAAAANVGLVLPKWVSRHAGAPGSFTVDFGTAGVQSVTITNAASYDKKLAGRFSDAVKTRTGAIGTKISRILAGEAVNMGFKTKAATGLTLAQHKASIESRESFTDTQMSA